MTTTEAPTIPDHPATFSKAVLDRLRTMLAVEVERVGTVKVLDPFAGPGGVHELAEERVSTFGVELQPEWAAAHADTICGDVLELPSIFPASTFDVIVTSPCYGNRMADNHQAADPCRTCHGEKVIERAATPDEVDNGCELGVAYDPCSACKGAGVTLRNNYAHALRRSGAEPVDVSTNAQVMQWGDKYRRFHEDAWRAVNKVLRPGGLVLLNVKNHVRGKEIQRVVEFHLNTWLVLGATFEEGRRVPTRGLAFGANSDARAEAELVLSLRSRP